MKQDNCNDSLRQLIQGLTLHEKNYFKNVVKFRTNRSETLTLKLFQLMDTGECYTTTQLREKTGIRNKAQFSTVKAHLQEDILDMLVSLDRRKDISYRLHFMQMHITTLFEKGLFEAAEKICKKGIALAKYFGKFQYLSTFLRLQNNAMQYGSYKRYKANNNILRHRIQTAACHQRALEKIRILYAQVKNIRHRTWLPISPEETEDVQEMKSILDTMKSDKDFIQSAKEQILVRLFYLNTQALCCYMLHEKELCNKVCRQILNCWNVAPHLIKEYPELFFQSARITSYNDFFNRHIANAKKNIDMYAALANKYLTSVFYTRMFSIAHFNTELKVYHKTARYDLVRQLIERRAASILSYNAETLSPPDALSVPTSIFISHFVLEQWDKAESLLLSVKEQNRQVIRDDILFFTLVFHLLIIYEKKDWYRIDSAIEAAYHFLYARKELRLFERRLLLFLKHLSAARGKEKIKTICSDFLNQMRKADQKKAPLYSLYFNFPGWVESKMKGISYMDYVREQVACKENEKKFLNPSLNEDLLEKV